MNAIKPALAAMASVIVLAACASTAGNGQRTASNSQPMQNPACLTQTGSRIPTAADDCSALGRSYSSTDISRTGQSNTADALSMLDPSIHH